MSQAFTTTPSGVKVVDDFRSNLIIDRYDPIFAAMRASKLKHICSENSEDAITWNVFRSLRQVEPMAWLPALSNLAMPNQPPLFPDGAIVNLWNFVLPPPGLLLDGDEGQSEIDVIIESPHWVWFIEAKYHSDISTGTTTRPLRNQVLRNIDVGSYYAGVRDFYFSLLIQSRERSRLGVEAVERYASLDLPRSELRSHRPDGLCNLKGITMLTWADLGKVLQGAAAAASREEDRHYAEHALAWLNDKRLI